MLHLIRASAGAGKTHRLVYIYLQHLLASPTDIADIVVLSFTNKATQELKERILAHLHALAAAQKTSMAADLQRSLHYNKATLTQRAKEALHHLLRHYDDFAVYTVDAFFQELLRTFTYELGLPANYQLLLEQDQLLDYCVTELLQQVPDNAELQKILTEVALQKVQQGKAWHFSQALKRWGYDLLTTWQDPCAPNYLTQPHTAQKVLSTLASLSQQNDTFRHNLTLKAKTILYHVQEARLQAKDFAWGEKGIIGFLQKIVHQQKVPPPSTRILQASIDANVWVSKTSPHRHHILTLVKKTLQPQLTALLAHYTTHYTHYITSHTLLSLRHRLMTTQKMTELIHQYTRTHDTILIHTLPQYIKKTITGNQTSFLYAKTGRRPQHLLVDESQDLSNPQWQSLAPLVQELVRQQHASYLVGDAKQAIYRWRGGNPQLLLTQIEEEIGSQHVQKTDLPYNWRSKPAIVRFNNAFFSQAAEQMTTYLQNEIPPDGNVHLRALQYEIAHIQRAYAHTTQKIAPTHKDTTRGYVHASFIPSTNNDQPWKDVAIQRTIQTIETLQEAGYPLQDITVLVRNHTEARTLLQALVQHAESDQARRHLRYHAIASSALSLADDPHVCLLITALRHIQHPSNSFTYAALQHGLQHYAPNASCSQKPNSPKKLAQIFNLCSQKTNADLPSVLASSSLPSQVYELIHQLGVQQVASEAHLNAFLEVVHDFSLRKQNTLPDFLRWWDQYGSQQSAPIPPTQEALKIMTIHQAKGLTFNAVILPFCHWHLDHLPTHLPMIWGHSTEAPFDQLVNVPLTYSSQLKETYYATSYFHEKWPQYLEQLNLLYVAFTRASDVFYLFAPYRPSQKLTTTSTLLTQLLAGQQDRQKDPLQQQGRWDPATMTWEAGVLPSPTHTHTHTHPQQPPSKRVPPPINTTPHKNILQRIQQPHEAGIWWHELLSQLTTFDDLAPLLKHYVHTQRLTPKQATSLQDTFQQLFEDQRLRDWFSPQWQVHTERTLMLASGALARPDRVMTQQKKAIVLDYKLGTPLPIHRQQIKNYVYMMTQLGYQDVQGYLLALNKKQLIQVT